MALVARREGTPVRAVAGSRPRTRGHRATGQPGGSGRSVLVSAPWGSSWRRLGARRGLRQRRPPRRERSDGYASPLSLSRPRRWPDPATPGAEEGATRRSSNSLSGQGGLDVMPASQDLAFPSVALSLSTTFGTDRNPRSVTWTSTRWGNFVGPWVTRTTQYISEGRRHIGHSRGAGGRGRNGRRRPER